MEGEEGEERRENMLDVGRCNSEIRKNFFVVRAAKSWNSLPDKVKGAATVNIFKNAYDALRNRETQKETKKKTQRPTTNLKTQVLEENPITRHKLTKAEMFPQCR